MDLSNSSQVGYHRFKVAHTAEAVDSKLMVHFNREFEPPSHQAFLLRKKLFIAGQ